MAKNLLLAKIGVKLDADTINYINDIKKAQIETDKRLEQMETSYKKAGKAGRGMTNSMKGQRQMATQLGFQLQDVAVQAQMGTSAFVIMGQQGSQLASVLGPGGALVGAAIAIGSALGGVLYTALNGAGRAFEDFSADARELASNLENLSKYGEKRQLVISDQAQENVKASKEKLSELNRELASVQGRLASGKEWVNYGDHVHAMWVEVDMSAEKIADLKKEQRELQAQIETGNEDLDKHNSLINEIATGNKGFADGTHKNKEALKELTAGLAEEIRLYGASEEARDLDTASRLNASPAILEQIRNQHALLNLRKEQEKQAEELAKRRKKAERDAEASATKGGSAEDKLKRERAARKADYDAGLISEQKYRDALAGIRRRAMAEAEADAQRSANRGMTLPEKLEEERKLMKSHYEGLLISEKSFRAAMAGIQAREDEYNAQLAEKKAREEAKRKAEAEAKERERIARERQLATDLYNFKLNQDMSEQQRIQLEYEREKELLEQWLTDQLDMFEDNEAEKARIREKYKEQEEQIEKTKREAQQEGMMADLDTIAGAFGKQTDMAKTFALSQLAISEALAIGKELEKGFPAAIPGVISMVAKFAALAGQFHGGVDELPASMDNKSFMLKAGERVVQPEANKKLTKFLDDQNTQPAGEGLRIDAPMTIQGNVTDERWFKTQLYKHRQSINESVKKASRERPARR